MFLLMYNLIDICQKHYVNNFYRIPHILKVRGKLLSVPINFLNAKIFVERSVRFGDYSEMPVRAISISSPEPPIPLYCVGEMYRL